MSVPSRSLAQRSLEDLTDEQRRITERFRSAFLGITGFGVMLAAAVDLVAVWVHGFDSPRRYLFDLQLGLQPSDGLATTGALLGLAVSINIALAAQSEPIEPRHKIRVAYWQLQMVLIMLLCGVAAVAMATLTFTSNPQPRNWGGPLAALVLAAGTTGVAAAAQPSARPLEALVVDEKMLNNRLATLTGSQQRLAANGAWVEWRFPYAVLAMLAVAGSVGLLSGLVGWGLFDVVGTPISLANLWFLVGMAVTIAISVLFGMSSYWTRLAVRAQPRHWPAALVPSALVTFLVALAALTSGPYQLRIVFSGYVLLAAAVPLALCVLEDRRPGRWMMAPVRSTSTRAIIRKREEIESALADVKLRQQRLGHASNRVLRPRRPVTSAAARSTAFRRSSSIDRSGRPAGHGR